MALLVEFAYRAVDAKSGGVVKGVLEGTGQPAVVAKLRAQGLLPIDVTPVSKTGLNQEIKLFPDSERRRGPAAPAGLGRRRPGPTAARRRPCRAANAARRRRPGTAGGI